MSKTCPTCGGTGIIKTEKSVRDDSPKWQLFERKHFLTPKNSKKILWQTEYAIISPQGVCTVYHISAPQGCIPFKPIYETQTENGEFWFWDFTDQKLDLIKSYDGWHKSNKRVVSAKSDEENQKFLERGYLPYSRFDS